MLNNPLLAYTIFYSFINLIIPFFSIGFLIRTINLIVPQCFFVVSIEKVHSYSEVNIFLPLELSSLKKEIPKQQDGIMIVV